MEDPKPEASKEPEAGRPCASSSHAAADPAAPDTKGQTCSDMKTDPTEEDTPSDVLLGE